MKVAPRDPSEALRKAQADSVPCPFMATMVNEGKLPVGKDNMVDLSTLRAALKQVGVSFTLRELLVAGTRVTEGERLKKAGALVQGMEVTAFDITKLQQTSLMHTGDLKIRRDGFKQERLDWLLSFSSDGKSLTLKDIARAQKEAVAKDPGLKGHVIGVAELSALVRLFGTKNDQGDKSLSKDALVSLFKDAKFPAGFEKGSLGAPGLFANMASIAFHQIFSSTGRSAASLDKAIGKSGPVDQSGVSGLGKAICPAGMRPNVPPATETELKQVH